MRRIRLFLVVMFLSLGVACAQWSVPPGEGERFELRADDIPGEWRSPAGGEVLLAADGRFTLSGFPREKINHPEPEDNLGEVRVSGSWVYERSMPAGNLAVQLYFPPSEYFVTGSHIPLNAGEGDGEVVLYFWFDGGADPGYVLEKVKESEAR